MERGGLPFDRVDSRAHSGAVQGTANMYTPIDGKNPIMNMGPVTNTNRHTAFDSSVVFHEFTHGVTNRLVGGPANTSALEADQSDGMGEGWSDYIPCTINDSVIVGDWVVDDPRGIREFSYDSDFPDNFENLGTGRYNEEHNIGEIWCATLLEMNRNIGKELGVQLVVDALKLTPANPSFLDARDAILSALDDMLTSAKLSDDEHKDASQGIWQAFARFGMGPNASSNGATLSGIVADFTVPGGVEPPQYDIIAEDSPNLAIPDNDSTGVTGVLTIQQSGKIARIFISVDVQHTYIGDLRVELIAPSGQKALVHNQIGSDQDNLIREYDSQSNSPLAALLEESLEGQWKLRVADLMGYDVGKFNAWSLEISY